MNSQIRYRADIDGLRAIAVLAVVFYHLDIGIFSGGFVGVDIFFVISGYLITSIIVREIEANKFSILKFYERRIRRIYPALYVVIVFVLLVSALLYDPNNFMEVGKSVMATTVFMSNMLFWSQSGYFDMPSSLKPMLHTWSLAVEEQFYIVLPLLVFFLMRFAKSWLKPALASLALISFGLSVYYVRQDASTAFYFAHLRAWELLIGSLLALNGSADNLNSKFRNIFALVGVSIILASIFLYSYATSFPGASALLPTLGTALVIYSGIEKPTFISNILSLPPFVFIGKISYSLYLWHWPIIVFGKDYVISAPSMEDKIIWLVVAFSLSILSWKFIENPFRSNSRFSRRKIFVLAGSAMAATLMAGAVIYFYNGIPQRFSPNLQAMLSASDPEWDKWGNCISHAKFSSNSSLCKIGEQTVKPIFIVWGDSHSHMLAPVIDKSARQMNVAGYLTSANGCPPLLDVERPDRPSCFKYTQKVFQYILDHPELKTVILAARWGWIANGTSYKTEGGGSFTLIDGITQPKPNNGNVDVFEAGFSRTVQTLLKLNRKVIIVTPIPEVGYDVPSAYLVALRTGRDLNKMIAPTYAEFLDRNRAAFAAIHAFENYSNVQIIDPSKILCDAKICHVIMNGMPPLYRDNNHLSTLGTQSILNAFTPVFSKITSQGIP